jgi:hypothetical protein
VLSAVGSSRREPCSVPGEAVPGGFGGSPPGSDPAATPLSRIEGIPRS